VITDDNNPGYNDFSVVQPGNSTNFSEDKADGAVGPTGPTQQSNGPTGDGSRLLYRVAGFWIRLLAFAIDLAVIACLNAIIWNSILPASAKQSFIYEIININSLFLGITGIIYFILMTHYYQQTLGKMITGIKVIQASGLPLTWSTVIFRELIARSLSQMLGLYLGYVFCWFNADKRCLHDFLSDTWVVHVKQQTQVGYLAIDGSTA